MLSWGDLERGGEGTSLQWGKFLMPTGHSLCMERSVDEGKTHRVVA